MTRHLVTIALIGILAAVAAGACKYQPVPDRVDVAGDSITWLSLSYGGNRQGWDTDAVGIGWQAEHSEPPVDADVTDPTRSPAILVVALGQNDVATSLSRDGFTQEDRNQLYALYFAPHDTACTAIVLPWYQPTPDNYDATQAVGINAYRTWVTDTIAPSSPRIRVVDWGPVAEAHPEYLQADGVHIAENATAAAAYQAVIQTGIEACP